MRTPPISPKIIATLPVFSSVFIAAAYVWHFKQPLLSMPLMLGVIAGGLVDLDNRLTGRLKNLIFTLLSFSLVSLLTQIMMGLGVAFVAFMTVLTFVYTMLGAVNLRYRTIAFGTLAVATYTILTYTPHIAWYINPAMILCGTVLYSVNALVAHTIFPHRPVQERVADAYAALGGYFDAKAAFFDPDEADWLESQQINLAMRNTSVIAAFNQCRSALFYRMRGQHRHPRTTRMLRYYFAAQDVHERISSAHVDYRELADKLKNTDLIFRIQRLLELQGQACRDVAERLRLGQDYAYSDRLERAIKGSRQSLALYAQHHSGNEVHTLQQLIDNLGSVDYQLSHLTHEDSDGLSSDNERSRIAAPDEGGFKAAWQTVKSQLNFESPVFRHAVRLSIVVSLSCLIVTILHLHLGYWILLTALFVCQPNYSATKSRVNQRVIGTILGVIVGSLVPYFTPSMETKLLIVMAATTLFFFFRTNKYSFSTFFITIQALTSFSLAGLDVYAAMPLRIIDTLIGSAIAWLAVSYLWPDWRYLTLERTAGNAIRTNAVYLRQIIAQLQNGGVDDIAYRSARRRAHEAAAALSSTVSDMSSEAQKYGHKLQDGFNLLKINYALMGYISALGAYRSHMQQSDSTFNQSFYQTAQEIVQLLDNIHTQDNTAFQTALNEVQQQLTNLRTQAGSKRQNNVLWQQLSMIVRQLKPSREALLAQGNETASA